MAYYITGDCHGEFSKIKLFCRLYNLTTEDVLIVLGDFGLNFWLGKRDIKNKKMLAQLPITILTIHGNHEARPYELDTYVEKQWNGGTVYVEEAIQTFFLQRMERFILLATRKVLLLVEHIVLTSIIGF